MGEADKLDGARKCSGRSLEQSLQLADYQMECGLVGSGHVRRAAGTHQGRCVFTPKHGGTGFCRTGSTMPGQEADSDSAIDGVQFLPTTPGASFSS